ncbi:MAG TPA: glutamate--cysteine ligase [Thermodesulfobacteriota bacterium]|nr:glutamate--cysteine ligase [Thermodesulfobacteriota bacterium]
MSQYSEESEDNQIIESKSDLINFFHRGGKSRQEWLVGTEYETLGVLRHNGSAVRYSGENGIETVLKGLSEISGWEPQKEDGHIIALNGPESNVALEPGGQIELSGAPHKTIHESHKELTGYLKNLVSMGRELDIAFLGLGMQPLSSLRDIEWVPKTRYRIMAPYMKKVSSLGHRMMKQTASIQVNVDYADEADAMMKFRLGMGIVPILSAMFANSPISEGSLNDFMTFRGHIWTDTDRDRSGLLSFAFDREAGFEEYVEYALDVPMYFIVRQGGWIDMTGIPFRRFLENGYEGEQATVGDWALHLTTLFPEVRIKTCIEIRCFDNQPQDLILSVPALVKGIFYEPDCLLAAWDLVKEWDWKERVILYHAAHRQALKARIRGFALLDIARELLHIAQEGLKRQGSINDKGEDESIYLEKLRDNLRHGLCPAYTLIEKWVGEWNRDIKKLIEYSAYRM